MNSSAYATVLSIGSPGPVGRLPCDGAALILGGHSVAMLVVQLPQDDDGNDRHILETGAIEVGLLSEGASALLAWRWKTGDGEDDVVAVDTPFHLGHEHPPHRFLPLTDDGRVPVVLVTQDSQGNCLSMRHGAIGREVTETLLDLGEVQLRDASRADFELRDRRNVRAMMARTHNPLSAFNAALVRSHVARALVGYH